jgi:two-component system response regulator BaeR
MNERHASMVPVGLVLATMFSRPGMGTVMGGLPLEIDRDSFVLRLYGKKIDLTPSEFKLVAALGAKPGRVWSRAQLLDVFSGEKDVFDRTIDSHVKNVRKKIAQSFPELDLIQSVYGIGYRLEV